ncbi:VanZ family protein [Candidatus Pelagibacter sp.]|nr:VanZ family protein [Candidatus Pelagibacter sp.]
MINFFGKYKIIFYITNFILILLYLFPGSLIGCFLYDDCKLQPQITPDLIISTNHLYAFAFLSLIAFLTFKKTDKITLVTVYLIIISIVLELFHHFIPERSFQYSDLFGNLIGVIIIIFFFNLLKKYENS